MESVFSSSSLDAFLSSDSRHLRVDYAVPTSHSSQFVSPATTPIDLAVLREAGHQAGLAAGLGHKGKRKRARTLHEKRQEVQSQIDKFGVAALEELEKSRQKPKNTPNKRFKLPKNLSSKKKDVVDVRHILRPQSHDKYISIPQTDRVVFITNKDGHLVPLSTLCSSAKSVMSDNVDLVPVRNEQLGRPQIFVRDSATQRLLALGGSRSRDESHAGFTIVDTPTLRRSKRSGGRFGKADEVCAFQMDNEYALFAAGALVLPKPGRVDIREIKRREREKEADKEIKTEDAKEATKSGPPSDKDDLLDSLYKKVVLESKDEQISQSDSEVDKSIREESDLQLPSKSEEPESKHEEPDKEQSIESQSALGPIGKESNSRSESVSRGSSEDVIENAWSGNNKVPGANPLEIESRPIVTEEFEKRRIELRKKPLAGVDVCDVPDCFCKEKEMLQKQVEQQLQEQLGEQSEEDGSYDHPADKKNATVKVSEKQSNLEEARLKKVRRALKNLGVTFLHLDEDGNEKVSENHDVKMEDNVKEDSENLCSKDHCRLGCICSSLSGQCLGSAPKHCGKLKCMFSCSCVVAEGQGNSSASNNGRRVLGQQGQEDRFNSLAAHEKRFANTVVMSGGGSSFLMLNDESSMASNVSGQQRVRRERKLPSRYQEPQDSSNVSGRKGSKEKEDVSQENTFESKTVEKTTRAKTRSSKLQSEETESKSSDSKIDSKRPHPYLNTMSNRTKKLLETKLTSGTIRDSTVLVPRVQLMDKDVSIWCMFHWQYDCPCFKMKSPEDFAPDRGTVVLRKKLKRKQTSTIDEEWTSEFASNRYKHDWSANCARTNGYVIKPSNRTKMPHSVLLAKKRKKVGDERESRTETTVKTLANNENNVEPAIGVKKRKSTAEESNLPFDLSFSTKGKSQEIPLAILKKAIKDRSAIVYVTERNRTSFSASNGANRLIVFVSKPQLPPYITYAKDLTTLDGAVLQNLPSLLRILAGAEGSCTEYDSAVVLTFNGIAWEMMGSKQKKTDTTTTNKTEKMDADQSERAFFVSSDKAVQKLPRGVNFVAMERPGGAGSKDRHRFIQIRLPATSPSQHWCTLRVQSDDGNAVQPQTVQCPNSSLALRPEVLRQAVNVACTEKTTVRIPIRVSSEVSTFGIYAVPSLETHVFVGPFSNKEAEKAVDKEVICIGDSEEEEETTPPNEQAQNQGSASNEYSTSSGIGHRRKQVLQTRSESVSATRQQLSTSSVNQSVLSTVDHSESSSVDQSESSSVDQSESKQVDQSESNLLDQSESKQIASSLLWSLLQQVVSESERKNSREEARRRVVGGQVPHVVQNGDVDQDVIVIDDDDDEMADTKKDEICGNNESSKQAITKSNVAPNYLTLPPSEHGKVVVKEKGLDEDEKSDEETLTLVVGKYQTTARIRSNGEVMMVHPILDGHCVICSSIEKAKCFLEELSAQTTEKPLSTVATKGALKIKSTEELCGTKAPKESSHLDRTRALISSTHLSSSSLPSTKEFFGLMSSSSLWRRTMDRTQILCVARDEILALVEEQKQLEETKRGLMIRRKALFCRFSQLLRESDFSPEMKKQRLVALKTFIQQSKSKCSDKKEDEEKKPLFIKQPLINEVETNESLKTMDSNEKNSGEQQQFLPVQVQPLSSVESGPQGSNVVPKATTLFIPTNQASGGTEKQSSPTASASPSTPYSDLTGLQTVKKDGKILRPMNAFMLWAKEYRKKLIAQGFDGATVSKILAEKWKCLSEEEKAKYHRDADHLKNMHQLQHPDYKYSPKSKRQKEREQLRREPSKSVVEIVLD